MAKKRPTYPVKELRSYVRESDNIVCYHPIRVKPKEVFVAQARAIWGDRYDYIDSVYTNNKEPITIRCRKHDHYFTVAMAQNHIMKPHGKFKPTGCPVCSYEQQYGEEYGTDWRNYLEPTPGQNRVRRIYQPKTNNKHRSPEEIAAEKAKAEARKQAEQACISHWKAKSLKEAHFLEKLQSRYPDMYDTSLVDYQDKDKFVTLICPTHGKFRITARQLFGYGKHHKAHGCWQCEGIMPPWEKEKNRMTADEFFQRMHQLYDATELDFLTAEFKNKGENVTAYCRKHGPITHTVSYWLEGKGCDYCNGKFYPPDFLRLAREKHGNKYQYRGVKNIKSAQSYIKIHCDNPDHHWHRQRVYLHLQGFGCVECSNYPNKKTPQQRCDEWIKKCIKKYGEGRYDYSRAHEDYVNNDSLVWIRCCIHDYWFQQTPNNNVHTVNGSCPICSADYVESQGEQTIRRWLEEHNITFEKEPEIPNENPRCKRTFLKPDFWLPDYNLYIEYNGKQHYEDVDYFHSDDWNLEDQQERDRTMRWYCEKHDHQLLEIPYWDYDHIGDILDDHLLKHNVN